MNDSSYAAQQERQELIKEAHCLIAVIASRPGSLKLLRLTVAMLQNYAAYKSNRKQRFCK
jgi:hypothetical protein